MSQPTSPNRDLPFRNVTVVRRGVAYRGVAVGRCVLLENGTLAKPANHDAGDLPGAERGITWIDGHHDYDSSEVQALLAAWALVGEKARDQDPPAFQMPPFRHAVPPLPERMREEAEARYRNVFDDED